MFKLVAVGGKLRGREFLLNEEENTFGRAPDVTHVLSVEGVSKKHMSITVNGESAFLQDLGSSNGTFLNGKICKKATIKSGDKIALPNLILELVWVKEKKVVVKKKIAKAGEENDDSSAYDDEAPPKDLIGKIKFIFRKKIMTILYGFNEQYEWRVIVGILLFIFIAINIALTILPVLQDSKRLLVLEIAERGAQYAKEVARANSAALGTGNLSRVNTSFLESDAEGVQSYELIDLAGRIVRPFSKQNAYTQDSFTVEAMNYFKKSEKKGTNFIKSTGSNEIGIARAISRVNAALGQEEVVGVISIRFRPRTLQAEAAQSSVAYLESLVTTAIVGIFFFGFFYYLTMKPMQELRAQIEEVLRGKRKDLESKHLMSEIAPLRSTINSILQRIRELQNTGGDEFAEMEEDAPYVRTLYEFLQGAQGPVMVLDSEKLIQHLNSDGEDLTGMRESAASGTSLLDSARDQGFAATVIDLCDQSANNEGANQSEVYELTGKNYAINVSALIGKDNFAKAFYVTFVLDE